MKELWDLAQENLVNIQGSYGLEKTVLKENRAIGGVF